MYAAMVQKKMMIGVGHKCFNALHGLKKGGATGSRAWHWTIEHTLEQPRDCTGEGPQQSQSAVLGPLQTRIPFWTRQPIVGKKAPNEAE